MQRDQESPEKPEEYNSLIDPSLTGRTGFIRKVYSLLSVQMIFTAVVVSYLISNDEIVSWLNKNILSLVLCIIAFIGMITILIVMIVYGYGWRVPMNYILLAAFNVCFTYIVAVLCSDLLTTYTNGLEIILMSVTMTAATTIGITIVAFTTNGDYTTLHPNLCLLMIGQIIMMLFMIFTSNPFYQIIFCMFGMIIYSGYIIIDTELLFGEGRYEITQDDYVIACLALYIDILMLFIRILMLVAEVLGKK